MDTLPKTMPKTITRISRWSQRAHERRVLRQREALLNAYPQPRPSVQDQLKAIFHDGGDDDAA